jgi:hypothetical protein
MDISMSDRLMRHALKVASGGLQVSRPIVFEQDEK